jgi:adenylylsulfate kinase
MGRERDRKAKYAPIGIYKRSKKDGATVPGVNVPYEEPLNPEVVVDSEQMGVDACAERVVAFIIKQGWSGEKR